MLPPLPQIARGPHRLVVRTSRCGRDNPGSTPGVVILSQAAFRSNEIIPEREPRPREPNNMTKSGHPESNQGPSDCCSDLQSDALPTEL